MESLFLSPAEIAESCVSIGKKKAALSVPKQLWLGVLAGMFIAFAGVAATFANVYVNKLAGAMVFPAGLAMVLLAGSELFTGNCLMTAALLRREITAGAMLRNWVFVYLGNLIGALFVSCLTVYGGTFDNAVGEALMATAASKASLSFGAAFLRGILCNILVCTAVWMSFGAKDMGGKVLAMYFPIMAFVVSGFEHSIANMFYLPAGILLTLRNGAEAISVSGALLHNLLPVTLGNIVGGAGVIALGYYCVYLKKKNG